MVAPYPAGYIADGDGFVPPMLGGSEAVLYYPFTFETADGQRAFTIPAGSKITQLTLDVDETFDGSATLSVGDDSSATSYLSAASVLGTAGPVYSTAWVTTNKWFTVLPSDVNVKLTIGGSPTQGAAVLICRYIRQ